MPEKPNSYLVQQRPDGFGEVTPLFAGQKYPVGRAADNRLMLRDDLCSRHHAEVFADARGWVVRDLGSLNGTAVNDTRVTGEVPLRPLDQVRMGRSTFVFVVTLEQLPPLPTPTPRPDERDGPVEIVRRLGQTRYLPPPPTAAPTQITPIHGSPPSAHRVSPVEAVGVLYRLGLEMADAQTPVTLFEVVLDALFRATPAEVGAVLEKSDAGQLEAVAYKTKPPHRATYHQVSQFVSREVLSTREAVLAEDVARDDDLRNRESINDLRAASLICAPIPHDGGILGLLHLYRTDPVVRLNADDLEFVVAVARQLGTAWQRLRVQAGLSRENQVLRDQLRLESELVGRSKPKTDVEQQIRRVAATKATVLVRGESGSGKELVARAIHFSSPRRDRPFVCLNCAAVTETLLESELFGHEKGAFTGATERKIGKFEAADGGTIFLDEIGEMAPGTQAKVLRVLDGKPFERVGGDAVVHTDVRVVAATNRQLEEAVRAGTFRKDLFFRIQVVQIDVPPLRARADDVPLLADHFLKKFAAETGRKVRGFGPGALDKLKAYHWPGNVRELRNVIERAVALGTGTLVQEADIWLSPLETGGSSVTDGVFQPVTLDEVEKRHIRKTLEHTDWNKLQTAKILGIERSTLDRKIKAYGLQK